MPPESKASNPKNPPKTSSKTRLVVSLILAFVALPLILFLYYQFTLVTGSEFDTGTWTVREFQYRQDLITHYQIAGRRYQPAASLTPTATNALTLPTTGSTAPTPVTPIPNTRPFPTSYFSRTNKATPRWDLVEIRASSGIYPGPAKVLTTYFQTPQAEKFWETWSKDNPAKAAELWQAARDLVDLGLYYALPTLMEKAPVDCSKEEFSRAVNTHVIATVKEAYTQLKSANDSSQLELADSLLEIYSN
jgi:hypothetical protein